MLKVIMLDVVMPNVVILNLVMQTIIRLSVVMLNVIILNVVAPFRRGKRKLAIFVSILISQIVSKRWNCKSFYCKTITGASTIKALQIRIVRILW